MTISFSRKTVFHTVSYRNPQGLISTQFYTPMVSALTLSSRGLLDCDIA